MYLKDLPEVYDKPIKIGSSIYLIRRVSGEVLETSLQHLITGSKPVVEVKWNEQHLYRLSLEDNTVNAVDCKLRHRQDMKLWYKVWEPHRLKLIELFFEQKKTKKKRYGEHGT